MSLWTSNMTPPPWIFLSFLYTLYGQVSGKSSEVAIELSILVSWIATTCGWWKSRKASNSSFFASYAIDIHANEFQPTKKVAFICTTRWRSLESDSSSINDVMNNLSSLLFDDAYQYFGKTFKTGNWTQSQLKFKTQSSPWFDDTCREAKQNFNRAKHNYSRCRSDINRINLTHCRSKLNKAKRQAKAIYKFEEGERNKNLGKSNTKQFWKEIIKKKHTKKKSKSAESLSVTDFFTHFSNVFETQSETNGTRSHVDTNTHDETLDCPFSLEKKSYLH